MWNEGVEQNNGKAPSGRLIKKIIEQRKQENVNQEKEKPTLLTPD
ncbi:MAG: hypothetical protein CLLPBCKN_006724 [Chroococcidiopsis cubana SAG 39.79]|uniref:Uncharacterized protein n=1 Tax=Chroococcidiopsis cubana SAG 39.79 TaxID=388085 RepID=A0AB37UCK4_9CYAN|nr:hypothetical protein [Chroococcidiopsis cubana]MDZ4877289.1 hypothetical protein [Chroococcidiopsis cubana SAG 39.79]RUT05860.1 hypothetical protein DSM107010_53900 [Chroococcidiopsis cubana SAG 39.79]